jgi:hypothetical protein
MQSVGVHCRGGDKLAHIKCDVCSVGLYQTLHCRTIVNLLSRIGGVKCMTPVFELQCEIWCMTCCVCFQKEEASYHIFTGTLNSSEKERMNRHPHRSSLLAPSTLTISTRAHAHTVQSMGLARRRQPGLFAHQCRLGGGNKREEKNESRAVHDPRY